MSSATKIVSLPRPTGLTELKPVPAVDVTNLTDERTLTLRRLLEEGHASMAPLRNPNLKFHTHLPHVSSPHQSEEPLLTGSSFLVPPIALERIASCCKIVTIMRLLGYSRSTNHSLGVTRYPGKTGENSSIRSRAWKHTKLCCMTG